MVYRNAAMTAQTYRNQQIMTASPAELTLMLYNGAIKFTGEAMKALEQKDYETANTNCLKAQDIISEFKATLDMSFEYSKTWMSIYNYIQRMLVQGNMQSDMEKLAEAKLRITEQRDLWKEIMKADRENKGITAENGKLNAGGVQA